MAKSLIDLLKRAAIGFAAGFLIACFVLVFLGHLPPHGDLSQPELEQQTRSLWLAFYVACAVALLAAAAGRLRLSKFWLWSCVAFGVICLIPFWPSKSGDLLPLATPYVNFGFRPTDVSSLLAIHVGVALAIAAIIQWVWPYLSKRFSGPSRPTQHCGRAKSPSE
jgi:hypothetical protein